MFKPCQLELLLTITFYNYSKISKYSNSNTCRWVYFPMQKQCILVLSQQTNSKCVYQQYFLANIKCNYTNLFMFYGFIFNYWVVCYLQQSLIKYLAQFFSDCLPGWINCNLSIGWKRRVHTMYIDVKITWASAYFITLM